MLGRARLRDTSVGWMLGDAAELPFRQEFDAVVIAFALHEMAPKVRSQVWTSALAAVRPGGTVLVVDYDQPPRQGLWARLISHLIEADERLFLKMHPPHYANFREWMNGGGLDGWLKQLGIPVRSTGRFFGGNVVLEHVPV